MSIFLPIWDLKSLYPSSTYFRSKGSDNVLCRRPRSGGPFKSVVINPISSRAICPTRWTHAFIWHPGFLRLTGRTRKPAGLWALQDLADLACVVLSIGCADESSRSRLRHTNILGLCLNCSSYPKGGDSRNSPELYSALAELDGGSR